MKRSNNTQKHQVQLPQEDKRKDRGARKKPQALRERERVIKVVSIHFQAIIALSGGMDKRVRGT